MKTWHKRFQALLMKYMAFPPDVLLDLPRITMIGKIHVYIENHHGIALFSEQKLQLKSKTGLIQILGQSLVIKMMHSSEILIEGKIHKVEYLTD